MKIEQTFNESIYIIPSFTTVSFQFLFWILYFGNKQSDGGIIWRTPFIAISWYKGKFQTWLLFLNSGFVNLKFKRFVFKRG